ncbi:MAG: hypothetical protein NT007_01015 [Candidatus Kapabacteria bacterium]|nr:hypothetical protein [Candidatus Kapabacteria bacterium]
MLMKSYFFGIIIITFSLSSCKDYNPLMPKENIKNLISNLYSPDKSKQGYLYSSKNVYVYKQSYYQDTYYHASFFYDSSMTYYPANEVKLNGNIEAQKYDYNIVTFDGTTNHIWEVTGNSVVPTYSDTILSLNSFKIVSPLPMIDSINKNVGINLSYTSINNTDTIYILANLNKGRSLILDSTYRNYQSIYNASSKINNGTINLPSSFFSCFPSNSFITIQIVAFRYKLKYINNKQYMTTCIVSSTGDYLVK